MSDVLLKSVTEAQVIADVKKLISAIGIKLQRINTGCFKTGDRFIKTAEAGTLDFEGYDNHGRFCAIECKRPVGGVLSPAQESRIKDINVKGGVAFVAHSADEALAKLRANNCI